MTCVLPYRHCNQRRFRSHAINMPCVFDGCEPLDFESALLSGDWPTQTKNNPTRNTAYGEDETQRATSGPVEKNPLKRKYVDESDEVSHHCSKNGTTESKKAYIETSSTANPSAAFSDDAEVERVSPLQNSVASPPSDDEESVQSHSHHHQEVASQTSMEEDEELYMPRRRVPQMWNSRQRWKDERKKVLKLSVNKLTEIEDPELWLLRSVLINNTIKRLHQDIRTERQAKIRHRQQKIDFYNDRYEPPAPLHRLHANYDQVAGSSSSYGNYSREDTTPKISPCPPSDMYDENSCDEIFGISEDFLRVTIPDRRVSSPIPTSPVQDDDPEKMTDSNNHHDCDSQNDTTSPMDVDQSSSESTSSSSSASSTSSSGEECDTSAISSANNSNGNNNNNAVMTSAFTRTVACHQTGNQCATQFRTNNSSGSHAGVNEVGVFPPRVPILDSVVYHSLLASLESS